jgi:hypothetical protein
MLDILGVGFLRHDYEDGRRCRPEPDDSCYTVISNATVCGRRDGGGSTSDHGHGLLFLAVRHRMLWAREDAAARPVGNNLAFFLISSVGTVVAATACLR